MLKRFSYLFSLIFVFVIPTIITGVFIYESIIWLNFLIFVVLITTIGAVWDIWATRHGKKDKVWLWQFNSNNTLGIKIFDIPIEEYLFYVFTSLYVVFIWEAIKLALETRDLIFYILVPSIGLWSLIFITIPYKLEIKGDKIQP